MTSILQKDEQTRGILSHVNKTLKYGVEIPSITGQSEGKDLTWCLLTGAPPAKENGTACPNSAGTNSRVKGKIQVGKKFPTRREIIFLLALKGIA